MDRGLDQRWGDIGVDGGKTEYKPGQYYGVRTDQRGDTETISLRERGFHPDGLNILFYVLQVNNLNLKSVCYSNNTHSYGVRCRPCINIFLNK